MAKKESAEDRHKPGMMIRVPKAFIDRLQVLVDKNLSSPTEEVRRAVREYLERHGLWPPTAGEAGGAHETNSQPRPDAASSGEEARERPGRRRRRG